MNITLWPSALAWSISCFSCALRAGSLLRSVGLMTFLYWMTFFLMPCLRYIFLKIVALSQGKGWIAFMTAHLSLRDSPVWLQRVWPSIMWAVIPAEMNLSPYRYLDLPGSGIGSLDKDDCLNSFKRCSMADQTVQSETFFNLARVEYDKYAVWWGEACTVPYRMRINWSTSSTLMGFFIR